MFKQIYLHLQHQTRKCSTDIRVNVKPKVILDNDTDKLIKQDVIKPRKHDGIIDRSPIQLPNWVMKAMKIVVEDYPQNILFQEAAILHRYLNSRLPPPEKNIIDLKYAETKNIVEKQLNYDETAESNNDSMLLKIHDKTIKMLKATTAPWAPINYDTYRGLMYMIARGAQDYTILYKIIREIQSRDGNLRPKTLLDFGSGIGSVSWVAHDLWNNSLKERLCIDISSEINDIAENLMRYASPKINSAASHRQYLPIASVPTYDIVVSSFSLMEMPNRKMRIDTIANLWRKTEKYLILVEYGTKGGFQIISEARDFLLHLISVQKERDSTKQGYVLSPCPHDIQCPRRATDDNKCSFQTQYFKMSFNKQLISKLEGYTYVVFKKGSERKEKDNWPRIIRPVLPRSGHVICRMCTSNGKLQEIIFSKSKHDRSLYRCAKSSRWGDRLPIEIEVNNEE